MKDCRGIEIKAGQTIAYCTRFASSMEQKVTTVVEVKTIKANGNHKTENGTWRYGDYDKEVVVAKNINPTPSRPNVTLSTPEYIVVIQ